VLRRIIQGTIRLFFNQLATKQLQRSLGS
jgi:hypothetical protein